MTTLKNSFLVLLIILVVTEAAYGTPPILRLAIGLQHPKVSEQEQFIKELHTKDSPTFHKFLTPEEWNQRFAPSVGDEQAVVDWATAAGFTVTHRFANRLIVDLEAPAAVIEKAFGVTLNAYRVGTRTAFSNDRDPTIPISLQNIVHSVGGLNSIQILHSASKPMQNLAFADYSPGPVICG
jgi:subtilase family serine protease